MPDGVSSAVRIKGDLSRNPATYSRSHVCRLSAGQTLSGDVSFVFAPS
jgi:hypothetical protein